MTLSHPRLGLSRCVWITAFALVVATFGQARAQFTRFENLTEEQGLGNASVSAIGQDTDGYMLIGTEAGLYRYDGALVAPYNDAVGLPSGAWIRSVATDPAGRVWVVTTNELFVQFRRDRPFERVLLGRPIEIRSPHQVALTRDEVLVDTGGVLLHARVSEAGVGKFSPLISDLVLASRPELRAARFVTTDLLGGWLIGCGGAICRVKNGTVTEFGSANGLPPDTWEIARRAPGGTLWARSLDRVASIRPGETSFRVAPVPGTWGPFYMRVPARLDIVPNPRGGIVTQGEDGLLGYDGVTWHRYTHHDGGLPASPLQALQFDREGSLWIGSMGHGAFRSIGLGVWEHWTADDGLPSDVVWSMTRLRNREFWVATYSDTAALGHEAERVRGGSENVAATSAGRLWIAPLGEPLVRLDRARNLAERIPAVGALTSMTVDGANRLWLCTEKGLWVVPDADAPVAQLRPRIALAQSASLVATDTIGVLWAVAAGGLYRRDPQGHFVLAISSEMIGDAPQGLAFGPKNELWVTTGGGPILRFVLDGTRARQIAPISAAVLGSADILFLHRDCRGWMWIGTDHGIDVFDGTSWRRFDQTDGLISNDMDQGAVYEDSDGSMWFGTSRGLSHLTDPLLLPPGATLHPFVTEIASGNRMLSPAPDIRLKWSKAPLVIRFADLDFAAGHRHEFRYRMVGLDANWNGTIGHDVQYAALPAGDLRFELIAADTAHGVVSAPVAITLHIRAPWWRRWWYYALLAVATGALIASLIAAAWKLRLRLVLRQQRRLEEMVAARTAEIEQAKSELQRLAMLDALTGLPNRRSIMKCLEEAVAAALASRGSLAVLLCDIDHFKKINDNFGHLAGDAALVTFGRRLSACVSTAEAAGRYGGEEFCIILPGTREHVAERVEAIRSAITDATYSVAGRDIIVTASGGVAFIRPSDTSLSLLARADATLYEAKEKGRNRIELERQDAGLAEPALQGVPIEEGDALQDPRSQSRQHAERRRRLEHDLAAALAAEEFILHYQPVIDLTKDAVSSFEALLRWMSPTRGKVAPVDFIPFAEEIGLMPAIGDWVLRTACREATRWPSGVKVSVNLSPAQFRLPDLVRRVEKVLAQTGLAPERLELELTETAMVENIDAVRSMLRDIQALGVSVALDDFGTGYSSLSFLRTLPFDRIKIDRSFVQDLDSKPEAAVIVKAIVGMCRNLGSAVTAEGVETDEQIAALRAAGCTEIQGYRVSRPCAVGELAKWISRTAEDGDAAECRAIEPGVIEASLC